MAKFEHKTFRVLKFSAVLIGVVAQNLDKAETETISTRVRTNYYQQLHNDILSRPSAVHKIPPAFLDGANGTYNMSFQLWLAHIANIDEVSQVITVNLYIDVRWTHRELSWNCSDYGGIDLVLVNRDSIWSPLILVVMGQKGSDVLEFTQTIQITSEGVMKSTKHSYLTFTCNINFARYPFDIQVCSVGFLSTGANSKPKITAKDLTAYPLSEYVTVDGEWLLQNVSSEVVTTSTMLEFVRYNFTMRRQRTYYVITCIFPLVLTSVMIPFTFLVAPETGEKFSYLVAMFTSTAIFLNYISDVMPRSLSVMPYLAVLLIEVLVEGLLAVLASVLVVSRHLQEKRQHGNKDEQADRISQIDHVSKETCKDHSEIAQTASSFIKTILLRRITLRMSSQQLDTSFFCMFVIGQSTFLIVMFGVTDWLWISRP